MNEMIKTFKNNQFKKQIWPNCAEKVTVEYG